MDPLAASSYARSLPTYLASLATETPWDAAHNIAARLRELVTELSDDFMVEGELAVHRGAHVDASAVIDGPAVVEDGAVVGPYVRLRDGAYIGTAATLGASVEVKSSLVFEGAALAHLNYVGNSVVGYETNIEAGAVVANHLNERDGEVVSVLVGDTIVTTGRAKFGAAIGPRSRIGANAVTTPGTILAAGSIVGRLELVDQIRTTSQRR